MTLIIFVLLGLDLPPPTVTTGTSGTPTVGQSYTLSCMVETVEFLFIQPTTEWIQNTENRTKRQSGNTTTLNLTLQPLASSDAGSYICRATIDIPTVDTSVSNIDSIVVHVLSKCSSDCVYGIVIFVL